jgi:maleylpyruvate isomerase
MNEVGHSLDRINAATGRLLASAVTLSDTQAREPSLLPGWTRGHVLTHVARNADGMVNLLRWARTGTEAPMYASAESRGADIEAGAGRSAADLATDVRACAAALAAEAATMPGDAWMEQVRALRGPAFPAFGVLERRLSEVEIHHVDLAAGYAPGDWPEDFLIEALPRVAESFAGRDDTPRCQVWAEGATDSFTIGPLHAGGPQAAIRGRPADVLAWLLGRDSGSTLAVSGEAAAAPALPAWR